MNGILIALSIILILFISFMVWGLRKAKQWRAEQEEEKEGEQKNDMSKV